VTDFERIFSGLEARQVQYLVVGGVAVVLHGHPRFTADLDLVLLLDDSNIKAALGALAELEYRHPGGPFPSMPPSSALRS
jgi:hypothetical protein